MDHDPGTATSDPQEFFDLVRRHKILFVVCAVACAAIAFGYSFLQADVYEATAVLLFRSTGGDGLVRDGSAGSNLTASAAAQVELRLFESVAVQDAARRDFEGSADVQAFILDEAVGLEVVARADTPDEAAEAANVYAQAYSDERVAARSRDAVAAQGVLRSQIEEADAQLAEVQTQLNDIASGAPTSDGQDSEQLTTEFTTLTAKKLTLQQRLDSLLLVGAGEGPEIVSPAEPDDDPVAPQPTRNAVGGFMGGLVLGFALMLVRERLDGVVRSEKALRREVAGLPVLAVIPHVGSRRDRSFLTIKRDDCAEFVEPLRTLRSAVQFSAQRSTLRSVLIVSPDPGDGKSTIALNLALTIGRAASSVVLVDADVRCPRVSKLLPGGSRHAGLTTVVAGLTGVHESVLRIEGEPNVAVLPAGPNDGWTGLVESESTRQTIEEIERLADFVVLDAPPVLPSADALTLCGVVDAVVLVVRVGHTRKVAIDTALRQLEQVGAPILGVVVNDSRKWSTNDYRYYQYASYSANDEYLGPPVTPDASLQVPEPDPAVPSAT